MGDGIIFQNPQGQKPKLEGQRQCELLLAWLCGILSKTKFDQLPGPSMAAFLSAPLWRSSLPKVFSQRLWATQLRSKQGEDHSICCQQSVGCQDRAQCYAEA